MVAVAIASAMFGALASGVGRRSPTTGSSSLAVVDRLLYPARSSGRNGNVAEVHLGPASGFGPRTLVRAPGGALFVVAIGPRFGAELTPDVPRREVRGRTFTGEAFRGELVYVSLDACIGVTIRQSAPAATLFDDDATTLLDSVEIVGQQVTVGLPAGWTSIGVGHPGNLVQVAFTTPVEPGKGFNLMQLPDTTVSALLGGAGFQGPIAADRLDDGRPAWSAVARNDDGSRGVSPPLGFTTIAWQNGPDAAVLYSDTATLDELKRVVPTLEPGHGKEFAGYTPTIDRSTEATTPTTLPIPEDRPVVATGGCATPILTVGG